MGPSHMARASIDWEERLLFGAERERRAAPRASTGTSGRRLAVMVLCLVVMVAILAWSVYLVAGR